MDNVVRLICEKLLLQEEKANDKDNYALLFLDMSSAYDNVTIKHVYKYLEENKVLTADELKLLKFIHSNITIKMGKVQCKTEKGVPQGLCTSPMLWNIYLNSLLNKLEQHGF